MKLLLSIYFFIIAVIQTGLLFGIYHYYRSHKSIQPSLYWMGSLFISVLALLIFGAGILSVEDLARPDFNFVIANTLFYVAAVLQALFCVSLNRKISRFLLIGFGISILSFILGFETMRLFGSFEMRTVFMASLASVFYAWQIKEIISRRRAEQSSQLAYLQYASTAELFFALCRIVTLIVTSYSIREVHQLPQLLILFTVSQLVMNTLSYIAIGGYWAEQIARANAHSSLENQKIKSLLQERESLIRSLLRANKTASTGALSASIAHELNQPLGASNLNIQFLQKRLAEGSLSPDIQKNILDTLLSDNQRAANIIRDLRSIFSEEEAIDQPVNLGELVQAVLSIAKPELQAKNIQITLHIEDGLTLQANYGELQQVMLNLINNAIEALVSGDGQDRRLTIKAIRLKDWVEISVADNGPGIAPSAQEHLFELLSTSKQSGMGLGLWLCKHIVTRHGGSIWFESAVDGGAKFCFQLPIS